MIEGATNDWGNDPTKAYEGTKKLIEEARSKGYDPVVTLPNKDVHGTSGAYEGALKAAQEAKVKTEDPANLSKNPWDSKESYHYSTDTVKALQSKYPGAQAFGTSNAVRMGAKEGVTGFSGKNAEFISEHAKLQNASSVQEDKNSPTSSSWMDTIKKAAAGTSDILGKVNESMDSNQKKLQSNVISSGGSSAIKKEDESHGSHFGSLEAMIASMNKRKQELKAANDNKPKGDPRAYDSTTKLMGQSTQSRMEDHSTKVANMFNNTHKVDAINNPATKSKDMKKSPLPASPPDSRFINMYSGQLGGSQHG